MADDVLKTLIAEAYAEGPEGMRRVAETILNRAALRGLTPEQVVRERKQYTGLRKPGPEARKAWSDPQALAAAQAAWELAQQPGDPTGGADHYYAPGTISKPFWANSMTSKGNYGGHAFFASAPIPPMDVPNAVGTALDVVPPPPAPAPILPSMNIAAMRTPMPLPPSAKLTDPGVMQQVFDTPAPQRPELSSALDRFIAKQQETPVAPIPASVEDRVTARNKVVAAPIPPRPPMMPIGAPQSYAGQDRSAPPRVPPMPMTATQSYAAQDRVVPRPSVSRLVPPMPQGVPQSYAGQDRAPAPIARPVPPMPMSVASSYAGQERYTPPPVPTPARLPPVAPPAAPVAPPIAPATPNMAAMASLYAQGGPTRPMAPMNDRLAPSLPGLPENYGSITPARVAQIGTDIGGALTPPVRPPAPPTQFAQIPPMPMARPVGVGTQLSVTPPPVPPAPQLQPAIAAPAAPRPPMPITPMPTSRPPLEVLVDGSNTIRPFSPAPPRPQTFRGTSNANRTYQVGQIYRGAGNRSLRANEDGSFTDINSGAVSRGSSQGPRKLIPRHSRR